MAATGHFFEDVFALLRQRNTSTLCWLSEACESLNTQVRAEHLTAETGHPFEEVIATCHPPGIAEQVARNSSDTQSAFRSSGRNAVWNFTSSMLMTVGDADTPAIIGFFHSVTFEPQRLTEGSATAVPSDSPRHGDVRMCIPPEHCVHCVVCRARHGDDFFAG